MQIVFPLCITSYLAFMYLDAFSAFAIIKMKAPSHSHLIATDLCSDNQSNVFIT